jgi:hypothetical protein
VLDLARFVRRQEVRRDRDRVPLVAREGVGTLQDVEVRAHLCTARVGEGERLFELAELVAERELDQVNGVLLDVRVLPR